VGTLNYHSVAQARELPGLRLVFSRGIPAPWGLAARVIFELKELSFAAVEQTVGGENADLIAWTGQSNAPIAVLGDERVRTTWYELLMLAEQLGTGGPRLVPTAPDERAAMFGISHEICSEDGLGWNLRTIIFHERARVSSLAQRMIYKYGSSADRGHAISRINDVLGMLDRALANQERDGSPFLVGNSLSAADIYWSAFSILIAPFSPDICESPGFYSDHASLCREVVTVPLDRLLAHRQRTARYWPNTPLRF
jgi:glutathione S-transferase